MLPLEDHECELVEWGTRHRLCTPKGAELCDVLKGVDSVQLQVPSPARCAHMGKRPKPFCPHMHNGDETSLSSEGQLQNEKMA